MRQLINFTVLIILPSSVGVFALSSCARDNGDDPLNWNVGGGAGGSGAGPTGEICGNGLDDTDNGQIDEGCACNVGAVQACFAGNPLVAGQGICNFGQQICKLVTNGNGEFQTVAWDECTGSGELAGEVCDQVDNDCDGSTDEGCACTDGDTTSCTTICGTGTQICLSGVWTKCSMLPPSRETCNGGDDNCNGKTDEKCACVPNMVMSCYSGASETLDVGVCHAGTKTCLSDGSGYSPCTDEVPPAAEICGNGIDDDCDAKLDEDCTCMSGTTTSCYSGRPKTRDVGTCHGGTMTCLSGGSAYSSCMGEVIPTMEICGNAVDDDCDGELDNGCQLVNMAACKPPQGVLVAIEAAGFKVSMEPVSSANLSTFRVICANGTAGLGVNHGQLRDWVAAGGGLFAMTIGNGKSGECSGDATLHPLFGFGYDCSIVPNPWGPVTALGMHPMTAGLTEINMPFVYGTAVTESVSGSSEAVAWVGTDVVARAGAHGAGRVFVYGDEHPLFAQYLPEPVPFFVNVVKWLYGMP